MQNAIKIYNKMYQLQYCNMFLFCSVEQCSLFFYIQIFLTKFDQNTYQNGTNYTM